MDSRQEVLFRLFTLGITLLLCLLPPSINAGCGQYTQCEECITQDPTCSWCNDRNVLRAFAANSSSTRPAQLCGTQAELLALGCSNVISPDTTVQTQPASGSNSFISVTQASVNLRPGAPASFNVTVTPPESPAVDMYLLVDLSLTMLQNINRLRGLAEDLVMRMRMLSSDFRIGFGSFIDKPVPPFSDRFNVDYPCAADFSLVGIGPQSCEAVYSYRHVLNFTDNVTALETMLNSTKLSASPDNPESILDAMLQSALCEDELGWRPRGQSQRIIVAFTDGDYHYALDGKIGGILSQPSSRICRLDPVTHEYSTANLYDYPSATLISDVLNENLITPIFAVPSQVRAVYDGLVASIRSATVETLSADSTGILSLIENQYRTLSGTVIPILMSDEVGGAVNISVLPMDGCAPGNLRANTSDVCVGINFPGSVTYSVEVSATPNACELPQPISARIQFIRFGTVDISITLQCDCNCDPAEVNSAVCSGRGTLECSTCVCNSDRIGGAVCECPVGVASQPEVGCRDPQDAEGRVCNGRGTCHCGQCQCDQISANSSVLFNGEFCQFDPQNCPLGRDPEDGQFKPCAGHGDCNSNSACVCADGFTGAACECTSANATCVQPGTDQGVLCSGAGQCICGSCVCNNYSVNFGQFCEECLPCRTSCSRVSPCVLCHIRGGAGCPAELSCQERLQVNGTADMVSKEGMKVCSLREGSCEVRYYLGSDVQGDEGTIQIFLDPSQSSLSTLQGGSSDCNSATPIWPIFVGIILGTIFVGILVIILWRCCTYLGEYLEYQQWSKSIKNDTERSGENPLFVDPTSEYSNPRYRPT